MVDKPPFGEPVPPSEVPATAQRASGLPQPAEGEPLERTTRRRRKKAVVEDRVARVEALVALSEPDFAQLSLPDDVERELLLARRLKPSGAKARQIRYVAKLLAGREDVFDEVDAPRPSELWADRLRHEGEAALEALLAVCPEAERQRIHQALRAADGTRLERYLAQLDPPAPEDDEEPADQA